MILNSETVNIHLKKIWQVNLLFVTYVFVLPQGVTVFVKGQVTSVAKKKGDKIQRTPKCAPAGFSWKLFVLFCFVWASCHLNVCLCDTECVLKNL